MANSATRTPERVAVIDVGSNSVLLLVLDQTGLAHREESRITRLATGVFERGVLQARSADRTCEAVCALARMARSAGAEPVIAVGTEALRLARDGAQFLDRLRREAGLHEARLLSGEDEARLAIEASRRAAQDPDAPLVVLDVGGGSTEIAWTRGGEPARGLSLPLGAVRLTEAWVQAHPVSAEDMVRLRDATREQTASLSRLRGSGVYDCSWPVALAGTATTLAALELGLERYDPARVEGFRIEVDLLTRWIERLSALGLPERRALPGLEPGREDVIVAGLVVLEELARQLGARGLRVSGRGLRYGVALGLLEGRKRV